jgi:outer membrane protein with beta-barrel domain
VLARFFTSLAAGVLLALTFPSVAAAEWHFVPNIGWTFQADTSFLDLDQGTSKVHWTFGGTVTLVGSGIFGVEGVIDWTPGFFTNEDVAEPARNVSKSHALALMGNAVLTTPRNWTEYGLRPFLSGGFGMLGFSRTEVNNVFPDERNFPAFNIGGGAIGFLSKRTGVRFDLRYYSNLGEPTAASESCIGTCHLRYMTFTAGVVIRR